MKIINFKEIPIALIRKILTRDRISEGEAGDLQKRVLEYSEQISKCPPDLSEKIFNELVEMGFREITSAQIINICPKTIDELKTLLYFEQEVPDEEVLNRVLNLLKESCEC